MLELLKNDSSRSDLERLKYAYTRTGNQTERRNEVAPFGQDESYGYDALYRLEEVKRGSFDNSAHAIAHDPAGNITKSPKPGNWTEIFEYVWDAWYRLVAVKDNGTIETHYGGYFSVYITLKMKIQ